MPTAKTQARLHQLTLLCSLTILSGHGTLEASTLYENLRIIDPVTQTITGNGYILVDNGLIAEIGQGKPDSTANTRVNMENRFALPGFIDAHAHITAGPMRVEMDNGSPALNMRSQHEYTRFHALSALQFGITTIRNPAGDPLANQHYSQQIATRTWRGPEALHAGFTFEPLPVEGLSVYPQSEQAWEKEIMREKTLGMQYIKLYTSLSEKEVAMGIRLAHKHGMQTIAHLDQVSWQFAIDHGIDALTHALPTSADLLPEHERASYLEDRKQPSSTFMYRWFEKADLEGTKIKQLIASLAQEQIEVDMTLLVNLLVYYFDDIDSIYNENEMRYAHPDTIEDWKTQMAGSHYGWKASDYERAHAVLPKVLEFTRMLHAAGVPMLIGTDSNAGGPFYHKELSLHEEAGIAPWDILAMATHLGAERLGIGDRTGSLQSGKEADIVFLDANPLESLSHAEHVHSILLDGEYLPRTQLQYEAGALLHLP